MEIPDEVKIYLRSVLASAAGTLQSKVCKEYQDITGSVLPYKKLGYKDIYSFLVALEGQVTRLEFSPKAKDNIVYTVLDETKFASGHAKKYAKKKVSGIRHKTPAEIQALEQGHGKGQGGSVKSRSPQSPPVISKTPNENLPTTNDWEILSKLTANGKGEYCLFVCNAAKSRILTLSLDQIAKIFSPYSHQKQGINEVKRNMNRFIFVSFPAYINAYHAWKDVNGRIFEGQRISVQPSPDNNLRWMATSHKIVVQNVPYKQMMMSTFVHIWALKYQDLLKIGPHVNDNAAIIYFGTKSSADNVIASVRFVTVNGHSCVLKVSEMNSMMYPEKPSVNEVAFQQTHSSPHGGVSQATVTAPHGGWLLPTPPNRDNLTVNRQNAPPASPTRVNTPVNTQSPRKSMVCKTEQKNEKYSPPPDEKPPSSSVVKTPPIKTYVDGKCGFCIDYQQSSKMFQVTCKRSPRTCRNIADRVDLMVTCAVDGCRFWIIVLSSEKTPNSIEALLELEKVLSEAVAKIQPPSSLPKEGMRGAALYEENKKWYRCYVLSSNELDKKLTVLFVDYGNTESVAMDDFRLTYNNFWRLPPLAVPCKVHGLEMKPSCTAAQIAKAKEALTKRLVLNQIYKATVVKSSEYSQPHIVELKDIRSASSGAELSITRKDLLSDGYLQTTSDDESVFLSEESEELWDQGSMTEINEALPEVGNHEEVVGEDEDEDAGSMFPFNEEDLIYGMVAEAHNPMLFYLHLGELSELAALGIALQNLKTSNMQPAQLRSKEGLLLYSAQDLRRRVLVLQLDHNIDKVKVLHVDYGAIKWVRKQCLFDLDDDLKSKPFQARPASLAGVQCVQKANNFLKSYIKQPIRTSVIKEQESGKLMVELFDVRTYKSLNLELVARGLAHQVFLSSGDDRDDDLSAGAISVAGSMEGENTTPSENRKDSVSVRELLIQADEKPRKNSVAASNCSWNSLECTAPIQAQRPEQRRPTSLNDSKSLHTEQWVENQTINSQQQQQEEKTLKKEGKNRPSTPPFPPPDIISSNVVRSTQFKGGVHIEEKRVYIGKNNQTVDVLNLNENNGLIPSEVERLRQKWRDEKQQLESTKKNLEELLKKSPSELREAFKEKKKRKLQLMVKLKGLQQELENVKEQQKTVDDEIESLLAAV